MSNKIMTPGMQAEGITSDEMEAVYAWGKELEKKILKKD